MKAKTEIQRTAVRLDKRLRPLSKSRIVDAMRKYGKIYANRKEAWCSCCGEVFAPLKHSSGAIPVRCPKCGSRCEYFLGSQKRIEHERYYYTVLGTIGEIQVVRNFFVDRFTRKGTRPSVAINEAFRVYINGKGERAYIGHSVQGLTGFYDSWAFGSPMSLKDGEHPRFNLYGEYGIRPVLMPELRRRHIDSLDRDGNPVKQIVSILRSPIFETMFKAGMQTLCDMWLYDGYEQSIRLRWPSIKIAMRHGFDFGGFAGKERCRMWLDMVRLMEDNGYDTRSPKNLVPADLDRLHREVMARDRRRRERLEIERKTNEAAALKDPNNKLNVEYRKRMGAILAICLKVEGLEIRPLQDVKEFFDEWKAMHHCVYINHYYDHPNTVIFSVRKDGQRVSTVEYNTRSCEIIQNRGKYNKVPEYDSIVRDAIVNSSEIRNLSKRVKVV